MILFQGGPLDGKVKEFPFSERVKFVNSDEAEEPIAPGSVVYEPDDRYTCSPGFAVFKVLS